MTTSTVQNAREAFLTAAQHLPYPRTVETPYGEHVAVHGTVQHLADTLDQPTLYALTAVLTAAQAPAAAPVPPVVVTINGLEVLVRHEPHGVQVDHRPAHSGWGWTPLPSDEYEVRSA